MVVISDTTAISNLYKIGKLDYLQLLFGKVIIPVAVFAELKELAQIGYDISSIINSKWIIVAEVGESKLLTELLLELDEGESEAIVLAKEKHADYLIVDEKKGRLKAEKLGIKTIGIIGILIQLKREKIIQKIKPDLDNLRDNAGLWVGEQLYNTILESENEK